MVLHILNASHDEALAADTPYYNETKAAVLTAQKLAPLSAFWAAPGDAILLPDGATPLQENIAKDVLFIYEKDLSSWDFSKVHRIEPWGWNSALLHRLKRLGVPPHLLPSDIVLENIRRLSSRRTAVELLSRLVSLQPQLIGHSVWCTSFEETVQNIKEFGTAMLKAPWSGSGRGVFKTGIPMSENVRFRVEKVLREQRAIEVEPFYHRVKDFAMEFSAEADGHVHYEGLSVFLTHTSGGYLGNIVADDRSLRKMLPGIEAHLLTSVSSACETYLTKLLGGHYCGPLGIDMMVVEVENNKVLRLHPCVEINLRRTMGHAAIALRKLLKPGESGLLCAEGFKAMER